MLKGVHLTLMIGPAVPVPAPQSVIDALASVQVNSGGQRSGFQLSFNVSKNSLLLTTMLPAGYFDPVTTRIVIIVTLSGFPNVIMDGIVTRQEMQPSNEPGQSTLTVTGEDLSVLMDVIHIRRPLPMPDLAKVYTVLAPYAAFGIVPLVIPPFIPVAEWISQGWRSQNETDRDYLQLMARDNGFIFYIEPGPLPLQSIAYFGPDTNAPIPQHALSVNMDANTNVNSLSFSLDGLAKKIRIFLVMDPITRRAPIPIPLPNINAFKPPLGLRPTPPSRLEFDRESASMEPDEAAQNILSFLMNNSETVSASGSLDVLRYGHVLRSRLLVGVRGAGVAYDGLYYVNSVTHNIKHGEYKQNFTLSRDGLISNTPKVLP